MSKYIAFHRGPIHLSIFQKYFDINVILNDLILKLFFIIITFLNNLSILCFSFDEIKF